jgi:peptide/nickel transport system permease protein
MLVIISFIGFVLIQLPPGDFLTMRVVELERQGDKSARLHLEELKARYRLDQPFFEQYLTWIGNFVRGDFGESFLYEQSVGSLIGERLLLTAALSLATILVSWTIGIPIGIYSATHRHSLADHFFTFVSFVGLGTPGFLVALIVAYVAAFQFGQPVGGLFSQEFEDAPWTLAKGVDLLKHLWMPALIVGISGTGQIIRIMRGNLIDTLGQPFILAARAKGLKKRQVVFKHGVRIAINPLITILGLSLPEIISGAALVSIVLNLPTAGPLYLTALQHQDMFLAGSFLMFLTLMLIIGNLLADIALAWADPRIRYD